MSTPQDPYTPPPGWAAPPAGSPQPPPPASPAGAPPGYGPPPTGWDQPAPGQQPPGWGQQQPGWGPPGGARPTNTLAIVSLVLIFAFTPAALITGIIARRQIRQTGEGGDGMALAGVICGALSIAFVVLMILFALLVVVGSAGSIDVDSQFSVRSLGLARWGA